MACCKHVDVAADRYTEYNLLRSGRLHFYDRTSFSFSDQTFTFASQDSVYLLI